MGHEKECVKCGVQKPLMDFAKHKRSRDGRQCVCRACDVGRLRRGRTPADFKNSSERHGRRWLPEELKVLQCVIDVSTPSGFYGDTTVDLGRRAARKLRIVGFDRTAKACATQIGYMSKTDSLKARPSS